MISVLTNGHFGQFLEVDTVIVFDLGEVEEEDLPPALDVWVRHSHLRICKSYRMHNIYIIGMYCIVGTVLANVYTKIKVFRLYQCTYV